FNIFIYKMTSFTAIPLNDIMTFLSANNVDVSSSIAYLTAWNLIKSNTSLSVPNAISDWFTAYILRDTIKSNYNVSDILQSSDQKLLPLTQSLNLLYVDKERIIRILGYLHHLNNNMNIFDNLPDEILHDIMSDLNCKSALLMCAISSKINNFCQVHLETILRQILSRTTKLKVDKFNRQQLLHF